MRLRKAQRPVIDGEQIEDMEKLLTESLANKTILEMITWKNGYYH
ncbi:YolD-like family protein [Metabacillus arenae]